MEFCSGETQQHKTVLLIKFKTDGCRKRVLLLESDLLQNQEDLERAAMFGSQLLQQCEELR